MGIMRRKFPHEINSYKSVMFFGLTARQAICVVCALVLAIPTALICSKLGIETETIGYVIIIEVLPFAAAGWINYNDMELEKFINQLMKFYCGSRQRKWQFINPETRVHDAIMTIEYERLCKERKQELADEKAAAKQQKRETKKMKKQKKVK